MKIFYLLALLGLVTAGTSRGHLAQDDIIVRVSFKGSGSVLLNYLNTDFRSDRLHIKNISENDTVIYRAVKSDRPMIFSFFRSKGKDLLVKQAFIAEPGDTLDFSVSDIELSLADENSKAGILNRVYGLTNVLKANMEYSGDISLLLDSVRREGKKYEDRILALADQERWSGQLQKAVLSYNQLMVYAGFFRIRYPQLKFGKDVAASLDEEYKKLVAEKGIFEAVYVPEAKTTLYFSILFAAWRDRKSDAGFYDQVLHMDKAFFKKRYTDGFLYDKMMSDESLSTIAERKELLRQLGPVILDSESFLRSDHFTIRSLDQPVLNTALESFDGSSVQLKDALHHSKKLTIIDFWASWCRPCLAEVPALQKIKTKYKDQVEVISISIDEDRKQWLNACKKYKLTEASYLDIDGARSPLLQFLQLRLIPRLIVLNAKGEMIEDDFYRPSDRKFEFELNNILNTASANK